MTKAQREYLETFLDQYIETALWSSTDESTESGGNPLDDNYEPEDLTKACRAEMKRDCADFVKSQWAILSHLQDSNHEYTASSAGHDFWLTRNGHGAGFWDRDLEATGEKLTEASRLYGSADLYVSRKRVHHG